MGVARVDGCGLALEVQKILQCPKAKTVTAHGITCRATVNFRLLVREKAKIHRSHKRVFNGLVVDIYTMWFKSIVPPLHGFCVCMDVQCFASWLAH